VDGHLPYLELWDNKPPGAFVPFALTILLAGRSIVAIRLLGAACVLASAYLAFLIGRRLWDSRAGVLAAVMSVVFTSLIPGCQATMTETLAMVPVMAALAILITCRHGAGTGFAAGVLLSLATLVRTNLVGLLVVGGIDLLTRSAARDRRRVRVVAAYALGALLPPILVSVPYVVTGTWGILVESAIVAPLHYADALRSPGDALRLLLSTLVQYDLPLVIGFLGGTILTARHWTTAAGPQRGPALLLYACFAAVTCSIVFGGPFSRHYVIQIVVFLALISGHFYSALLRHHHVRPVVGLFAMGLALPVWVLAAAYWDLGTKTLRGEKYVVYELADYLRDENPRREPVYLMDFHLVYWLTGTKPLSRLVTHPSNITRESLLPVAAGPGVTPEREMTRLLEMHPRFIVKRADTWYVNIRPGTKAILEQALERDYELVRDIRGALVYRRKAGRLSTEARPAPPLEVRAPGARPRFARGQPG
jgi:Dolichyl-phosphate-mannose-protein mannosyltransferase